MGFCGTLRPLVTRPKNDKPDVADAVEDPRPLTPVRTDGPTHTVIVADQVEPTGQKTAAMPAWPVDGAPLTTQPTPVWNESAPPSTLPTTQPTPVWDETVPPRKATGLITEPTPAWEENASSTTRPMTAHPKADLPTRAVLQPVVSEVDVRKVVTRPTEVPLRGRLPRRVNLVLAAVGSLTLVLMLWLFGRSDTVKDPSRPVPISKLPIALPKEPPPPQPKRIDVTPIIAAPKELPRPPLSMELVLDAGAGLPPEKKTVPASIVRIETEPTSSVSWNGTDFGWQPALITMPVGQNFITVENKELNLKKTFAVTAADTEKTFLRFEFSKGWLSVDRPANAKVSVEGLKVTGRAILLWEGRHRVDCVFGNGQKASKLADVVRGETAEIFFDDPLPQE